uniref:Uncharacterized protein n=1 Tax=Plectus sambesii TaxID=2011161 RepID=A0A914UJY6_9BILA
MERCNGSPASLATTPVAGHRRITAGAHSNASSSSSTARTDASTAVAVMAAYDRRHPHRRDRPTGGASIAGRERRSLSAHHVYTCFGSVLCAMFCDFRADFATSAATTRRLSLWRRMSGAMGHGEALNEGWLKEGARALITQRTAVLSAGPHEAR